MPQRTQGLISKSTCRWAASMLLSGAILARNPYMSFSQKVRLLPSESIIRRNSDRNCCSSYKLEFTHKPLPWLR